MEEVDGGGGGGEGADGGEELGSSCDGWWRGGEGVGAGKVGTCERGCSLDVLEH